MDRAVQIPSCPRCGYDQSGAITAWERIDPPSCPLDETCTECGLTFAWRDVLNPMYRRELRFFENAMIGRAHAFRLTWWKAARPWEFWRWVKMEHALAPWRIVLLAFIGMLLTHLAVVLVFGLLSLCTYLLGGGSPLGRGYWSYFPEHPFEAVLFALYPFGHHDWSWGGLTLTYAIRPLELIAVGGLLIMPLTFLCLPQTLRRAKVRKRHLLRIEAYSLVWFPVPASAAAVLAFSIEQVNRIFLPTMGSPAWVDRWTRAGMSWAVLVMICLWLAIWWAFAAGRYLRLPHVPAIGVAMTIIAMLAATLLTLIFPGGDWIMHSL